MKDEDVIADDKKYTAYCVHCGSSLRTFPDPHNCIENLDDKMGEFNTSLENYEKNYREVEEMK
jgi:hypothetical protein